MSTSRFFCFSFLNFFNFYLFRFPLQQGTFEIQNRILSKYITLSEKGRQVNVYSSHASLAFRDFLFYSNIYNKKTVAEINTSLSKGKLSYLNIVFSNCDQLSGSNQQSDLIIEDAACSWELASKKLHIVQLKDSGGRYQIYNDQICNQYNLPHYISNLSLADLNIEKLSQKQSQKFKLQIVKEDEN